MYTEKQLVSFGNYLLKRYNVQVYSTDGTNTPVYGRQVTDADCCNWQHENGDAATAFGKGDAVFVGFRHDGPLQPAVVQGVHHYGEKVKYDLSLTDGGIGESEFTRIYNVEAQFVTARQ